MKIAQVGPIWKEIPPLGYGGTELIVSLLTEELVKRGHDIELFATGDSQTKAKLNSILPHGLYRSGVSWHEPFYPLLHISKALDRASEFDIIHLHLTSKVDYITYLLVRNHKNVLFTCHIPLATENKPDKNAILLSYRSVPVISISNNQRQHLPLNFLATVYNAIEVQRYLFNDKPTDYIFWLSRVGKDKGTKEVVEVGKKAQHKVVISGRVDIFRKEEQLYYETNVKPFVDGTQIKYIEEVDFNNKIDLYKNARLFLFPINWEEPFGLVLIEAMACGTPIVAYARGSVPEVVKDGETGFIVNSSEDDKRGDWIIKKTGIEGLCEAVEKIYSMPEDQYRQMRKNCRAHVEKNFTVERMVDNYEKVYQQVVQNSKK